MNIEFFMLYFDPKSINYDNNNITSNGRNW